MSAEPVDPNLAPRPEPAAGSTADHSCEHCGGHGSAANPAERAREHLSLGRRRTAPRVLLGLLGLGAAMVFGSRAEVSAWTTALIYVLAAVAWLVAAWGGVMLGAMMAGPRSARAQLALGQVIAAALAVVAALGIALSFRPADEIAPTTNLLATGGIAAASGWFLASAIGELVRLRALGQHVAEQDERGMVARAEAETLTQASIGRAEVLSLALAVGFGATAVVLALMPILVLVLVPLAAAGAAWWGLRRARQTGQ